jgi:predicted MFS family arabinose efflux permease
MLAVSLVPGIPLTMVMLLCSGFGAAIFNTASSAVIQLASSSEYHGRVMAMFSVLFVGTKGIGGAFTGAVSEGLGVRWAIAFGAIACLLLAVWARAASVRSIGQPLPAT